MKYRFATERGNTWVDDIEPYLRGGRDDILSIVREDQVRVSPREVHERAMELWVNEGAPGDELPEGRHYRRALAELEGEGMKAC